MLGLSSAAAFAFALANPDRIPNDDAIAMSPTVGWVMLACAVFACLIFLLQSERWRRWWLTNEDPRPVAMFRIVFAFLCICNINDVFEYMLLRSGRLILHPSQERRAIVLENVFFINRKEEQITKMLSALQVQVRETR